MRERCETTCKPEPLAIFLRRFFKNSPQLASEAIEYLKTECPGISNQEIFSLLSKNKGIGKSHASRYVALPEYEGRMKGT